jgi:hypothetical protein
MTYPAASTVVYRKGDSPLVETIALDSDGDGHRKVDFGRADVWKVDLVLTNGSLRFSCPPKDFPESVYSCGGFSRDDQRAYHFRARAD